jgi:hypothetical protein
VTRSTVPARCSTGVSGAGVGVCSDIVESLDRSALHAWLQPPQLAWHRCRL